MSRNGGVIGSQNFEAYLRGQLPRSSGGVVVPGQLPYSAFMDTEQKLPVGIDIEFFKNLIRSLIGNEGTHVMIGARGHMPNPNNQNKNDLHRQHVHILNPYTGLAEAVAPYMHGFEASRLTASYLLLVAQQITPYSFYEAAYQAVRDDEYHFPVVGIVSPRGSVVVLRTNESNEAVEFTESIFQKSTIGANPWASELAFHITRQYRQFGLTPQAEAPAFEDAIFGLGGRESTTVVTRASLAKTFDKLSTPLYTSDAYNTSMLTRIA